MPRNDLIGKRVAILATDGVEAVELIDTRNALDKAGAKTLVVSPNHDKIRSWEHDEWADDIPIDLPLAKCSPDDFEALVSARRRDQRRPPAARRAGRAVRPPLLRDGQARGRHLPRSVDSDRGERRSKPHAHVVAVAPDGSAQRGRGLGGSRSRDRHGARDKPRTGGPSGVHLQGDRGVRGRDSRRPADSAPKRVRRPTDTRRLATCESA